MMNWQLQNFDQQAFIRDYWQKKPCLIRQAFADVVSPISPEELAGLACEEDVHSRLVMEKGGTGPWQLKYGPFKEADFLSLPDSHYSLLVSECEKWLPEFTDLLDSFRFLPKWRIDDVMISYAPAGGSVGPHIDEYDVFLLQIEGQRNWQYDTARLDHPTLIPDLDLAILESFNAQQSAILEPGDMLYLPPGIPHHGVAVDGCMTCSVGFRAPTATEVLESFALEIDKRELGAQRYRDPDLETNRHTAEITSAEISNFRRMVENLLDQPDSLWLDSIGKLLSDTVVDESADESKFTNFEQLLADEWMINPDSKILYHCDNTTIRLYCNGQVTELAHTKNRLNAVQQLCTDIELPVFLIKQCQQDPALSQLLLDMVNRNALIPLIDE